MKSKKKIVIGIILVLIIFLASGIGYYLLVSKKENKREASVSIHPALYQACDDDSCIYILGTMHMADAKLNGLSDQIWKAYNESDAIAFELDVTAVPADASMDLIMLKEGDDLSNYLSKEDFQKLEKFFANRLIPIDVVRTFNLAGVASLIEEYAYMELQLMPNNGVDMQLLTKAHQDNKEIIELETYEFQVGLLYGFKDEYYVEQINSMIDNYSSSKANIKLLYNCYVSGNTWLLKQLLSNEESEDEVAQEYNQKMLIERNVNMTEQAEQFLKENKKVTVAVGAAHVIGEKGILELLTEKGYKISLVK